MYKQIFSPKHLGLYVLAACMASCGGDDNDGFQFGESTGGGTGVAPSTEITTRMETCLLYPPPSPQVRQTTRMPSYA